MYFLEVKEQNMAHFYSLLPNTPWLERCIPESLWKVTENNCNSVIMMKKTTSVQIDY